MLEYNTKLIWGRRVGISSVYDVEPLLYCHHFAAVNQMFASKIVSDPEVQPFIVKMVVGEDRPFAGVSSAGDLARQPLPVMLVAMKLCCFLTWFPN